MFDARLSAFAVALTLALSATASRVDASPYSEPALDSLAVCLNYLALNPRDGTVWGSDGNAYSRWLLRLEDRGQSVSEIHHFWDPIRGIHFLDDGTMFVSTDVDHQSAAYPCTLFRSTDAGQTFVPVKVMASTCAVSWSFAHDRLDNLYVGEYGPRGQGQSNRVWRSSDKGETWSVIFQTPEVDDIHIHRVAVDPYTQDLWVTFGHSQYGTYRSRDGGQHWTFMYASLPTAVAFTPEAIYWGEDSSLGIVTRYDRATGTFARVLQVSSLGTYGGSVYDMTVGPSGQVYVPFKRYTGQSHHPTIWVGHDDDWRLLQVFGLPGTGASNITPPDANGDMFVMYHRIHEPREDTSPPATPSGFTAAFVHGATALHWGGNREPDFWSYRLYGSTSKDFVPDHSTLMVAKGDTGYFDRQSRRLYYKLTAVDRSGNESAWASVTLQRTVDVPAVAQPLTLGITPNPTTRMPLFVQVGLPTSAPATLELLDVAGRRLCIRYLGESPGTHAVNVTPNGSLSPGVYFLRLTQGRDQITRRVALTR